MSSALPYKVALVSRTGKINMQELTQVSAALSLQVQRDFAPIWGVTATVDPFPNGGLLAGYWPIIVEDDIGEPGAAGYHTDDNHKPYALVEYSKDWSVTASHELLEMLADPYGNRTVASRAPRFGQKHVEYLVEVCDPCEAITYDVAGVTVSDFYTPQFFDYSIRAGVGYSFTGAVHHPRQVLLGGYLSWINLQTGHIEQETYFGKRPEIKDLGPVSQAKENGMSLREFVDRNTATERR